MHVKNVLKNEKLAKLRLKSNLISYANVYASNYYLTFDSDKNVHRKNFRTKKYVSHNFQKMIPILYIMTHQRNPLRKLKPKLYLLRSIQRTADTRREIKTRMQ